MGPTREKGNNEIEDASMTPVLPKAKSLARNIDKGMFMPAPKTAVSIWGFNIPTPFTKYANMLFHMLITVNTAIAVRSE